MNSESGLTGEQIPIYVFMMQLSAFKSQLIYYAKFRNNAKKFGISNLSFHTFSKAHSHVLIFFNFHYSS